MFSNSRYAWRRIQRSPGTAVVAVLVIALGITVAVPLYAFIKSIAFGSLPFPAEDRIVRFIALNSETGRPSGLEFSQYELNFMEQSLSGIDEIAAYNSYIAVLSDSEVATDYVAAHVDPSVFSIMPASPILGRTLLSGDGASGAPAVSVISFDVWQNYYAGDLNIIGRTSRINSESYTIVGVMPEGYTFPEVHEIWTPLATESNPTPGGLSDLSVMARLSDSVDIETASRDVGILYDRLRAEEPEDYSLSSARVIPFTQYVAASGNSMPLWYLMSGIAAVILAIVAFNLANLLVIRANERTEEFEIRKAVGSTRTEVFAELLRESFLICIGGLLVGTLFVFFVLQFLWYELSYLLETQGGFSAPPWFDFGLSFEVIILAVAVTIAIWLVTGFFSFLRLRKLSIEGAAQSGSRSIVGKSKRWANHSLVGLEITVSTGLLILCGAIFVAAYNGSNANFGVAEENFLTGYLDFRNANYQSVDSRRAYVASLQQELSESSDFSEVVFSTALPGQAGQGAQYALDDREYQEEDQPRQGQIWISENFFEVFEVTLREGRWFDATDGQESQPVVIVDELFAELAWPDESAIGKRIQVIDDENSEWLDIVGVTSHIIHDEPMANQASFTSLYRPIQQASLDFVSVAVKANSALEPNFADLTTSFKEAAARVDRDLPIINIHSLERVMSGAMNLNDVIGELLLGMAIIIFSLAVIAIFAIVSRSIISRTTEVGVRQALGATKAKALFLFIKQGINHLIVAIPIGGGLGVLAGMRFMSNVTDVGDIVISVAVTVSLLIIGLVLIACYMPARKVVAMEPGEALHYE